MSQYQSLFFLIAGGAALIAAPVAAQDDAPQDVFIVEPDAQPAAQDGYPAQQPTQQPAQQQGYPAQPTPAPPAAQAGAPVYAQPYQQQQQQQPQPYAPQPTQGRRLRVPYIEGAPMPPGGVLVERRRTGLVITGAIMFGAPWISTLLAGVSVEEGVVAVPIIGPLLYLGHGYRGADTMLVLDSVLQATGITLFILGMVMKRNYVEYYGENSDGRQWSLLPQVGTTNGLQLDMRF